MIALLGAVLIASVLGSLHCVGMCGPLAILAVGTANGSGANISARSRGWRLRLAGYHGGRLLTYLTMGIVVGSAGLMVDSGGKLLGFAGLAANVAGVALVAMGIWRLVGIWSAQVTSLLTPLSHFVSQWLSGFRQLIAKLSPTARATAMGALTTLLPCGWLYVFALVASGTGDPFSAVVVMAAFWIGTLPALTATVAGFTKISTRIGTSLPVLISLLMIGTGWYTATGRAFADFRPLIGKAAGLTSATHKGQETPNDLHLTLEVLTKEPLPCCQPKEQDE